MKKGIVVSFAIWRTLLILAVLLSSSVLAYRAGYEYTNIFGWVENYFPVSSPLLSPWANFDGVRYLAIAGRGYVSEAAFFPLYPFLIRLFSLGYGGLFSFQHFASGLLISNISFLASLFVFYKLLLLDHPERVTQRSIVFLLFYPAAFYFGSVYSEGLFFLLLVSSFYFARTKKWGKATLLALLLTLTRPVGFLVIPALVTELYLQKGRPIGKLKISTGYFRQLQNSTRSFVIANWKVLLQLIFVLSGLIAYGYYNQIKWGDFFYFINQHANLGNSRSVTSLINPLRTIFRYAKIFLTFNLNTYEWWIALLEVASFSLVSYLLALSILHRQRISYIVFSLFVLLVPVLSGTLTGFPRYSLMAFPVFVELASLPKTSRLVLLLTFFFLQFILVMLFARGYYVS